MSRSPPFLTNFSLITGHGKRLSRSCLSISKNSCAIAIKRCLDELVYRAHRKNFSLSYSIVHYSVESVLFTTTSRHCQYYIVVVNTLDTSFIISLELVRLKWAYSNGNFNSFTLFTVRIICFVLHVSSFIF